MDITMAKFDALSDEEQLRFLAEMEGVTVSKMQEKMDALGQKIDTFLFDLLSKGKEVGRA